jgi:hypothetical protein
MLFREIIAVYSDNHMKFITTFCGQNAELLVIKTGGVYSCSGFKGLGWKKQESLSGREHLPSIWKIPASNLGHYTDYSD